MVEVFQENPLLLLFAVIALGYGLGEIRIRGFKLGVAAVLFVGLGFGAIDPSFSVPQLVIFLGLTIFVYTVGLSSAPAFFASFKQGSNGDLYFIIGTLILSAGLTWIFHWWFGFDAATTGGLFAGASTNTPALAGLLDAIEKTAGQSELTEMSQRAVVGYSLSYPMGVLGVMLGIGWLQRIMRVSYRSEAEELSQQYPLGQRLSSHTLVIEHESVAGKNLRELKQELGLSLVFGRIKRGDQVQLSNWDTELALGDELVVIGAGRQLVKAREMLGPIAEKELSYDRSVYDVRRLFVSNPDVAGKTIASLNLGQHFSVLISRVQRGDMDLLAGGDTVLELGDRVLLVARREDLPALFKVFGNSYESLSRINLLSFGLGITLGLLLGLITISLPGGYSFSLGYAGGPLIVALVLGQLRRTGPIVWTLPYGANLTLRQLGLILLLAGIGIRSGQTFYQTLATDLGWKLFLASTVITILTTVFTLAVGLRLVGVPFSFLTGMVSSQPAVLDFAIERAGNNYPLIGYTRMLPVALIGKILLVQIMYGMLV
ncbi:MAG: TrkA C-terminal domain-containing protein [Bacteroidota bacterium]